MNKKKKKIGLTTYIFIALLLGALTGVLLHYFAPAGYVRDQVFVAGIFEVCGTGFLRLMQMLVVPLVFCSLVCGSSAIGDTKSLGKVGIKTLAFYLVTTALAISVALAVGNLHQSGHRPGCVQPADCRGGRGTVGVSGGYPAEHHSEESDPGTCGRKYASDHCLCPDHRHYPGKARRAGRGWFPTSSPSSMM